MVSLVCQSPIGTGTRDQSSRGRAMNQMRRLLALVDVLAPMRRFQMPEVIAQMLRERLMEDFCDRTVTRDLALLAELGLVETDRLPSRSSTFFRTAYRLNLRSSESLQAAAIKCEEVSHAK